MGRTSKIKATISAKDNASKTFKNLTGVISKLGVVAIAVGAIAIGKKLVQGMALAVKAAGVQEAAEVKLAQAIKLTGGSAAAILPQLKAYASELQNLTGVGDEVILSNQALLVGLGKLEGEGLRRATRASLDLAAATGVATRTAFDLVAKAATGYTGTLSRYGIIIDQSLSDTDKFAAALSKIEELFGGQAAARLKSYEGRIDELAGRFGDLQEAIGGPLRDVLRVVLGELISPFVKKLGDAAENSDLWKRATIGLAIALLELGAVVASIVEGPMIALSTIVGVRLKRDFDILRFGVAIASVQMAADLQLVTDLVAGMFAPSAVAANLRATADRLRELLDETNEKVKENTEGYKENIKVITGAIITANEAITEAIAIGTEATKARLEDAKKSIEKLGKAIQRNIRQAGVTAAVQFGDALVDAAFGAKKSFGDMFVQLIQDLGRAILKAIILRTILTAFGFGSGGGIVTGQSGGIIGDSAAATGVEFKRGGIIGAQSGIMIAGLNMNKDSVPILAQPGEMILPRDVSDAILAGVRGGSGQMTVLVEMGPNISMLAESINVEVRRGGVRLLASEIVTSRSLR